MEVYFLILIIIHLIQQKASLGQMTIINNLQNDCGKQNKIELELILPPNLMLIMIQIIVVEEKVN